MGLGIMSSSSFDGDTITPPNPKPDNYSFIRAAVCNGYLIVELKYHDCINYAGRKIMMYECTLDQLIKQKLIDPHFSHNKNFFSPIARFVPTEKGWDYATSFAFHLEKNEL